MSKWLHGCFVVIWVASTTTGTEVETKIFVSVCLWVSICFFSLATAQALLSSELATDPGSHCVVCGPEFSFMIAGCCRGEDSRHPGQHPLGTAPTRHAYMDEEALRGRGEGMSKT